MTKPDTRPELVAGAKRFLAHWPDDTIEGAAVHTLLAHCAETEAENEQLRLEICGGEDAPGYAAAQSLETILSVLRENYSSWQYEAGRAGKLEGKLAETEQHLAAAVSVVRDLMPSHNGRDCWCGRDVAKFGHTTLCLRARALLPPADGDEHG